VANLSQNPFRRTKNFVARLELGPLAVCIRQCLSSVYLYIFVYSFIYLFILMTMMTADITIYDL